MRVLVVEDDERIAASIRRALAYEGYSVTVVHDGGTALEEARSRPPDLLLLDLMLPGIDGIEVCRRLREAGDTFPILMLTARDGVSDRVGGLDAGADDYLTKPFGFDELLARIRALLRRGGAERPDRLMYADVEVDRVKHVAFRTGERLRLTPKEFQLLEFLVLNSERVVRRTELLEKVWDLNFDPMSNVVDVHVGHLRRKLTSGGRSTLLHTVRGVGYLFQQHEPE